MKIEVLQTGRTPDEMRGKHGDYDDLFKRLLAGRGVLVDLIKARRTAIQENIASQAEKWIIEPLISAECAGRYEEFFKCHRPAHDEI